MSGYAQYILEIAHFLVKFSWDSVIDYHLDVCKNCMYNQASAHEWHKTDIQAYVNCLSKGEAPASGPVRAVNTFSRPTPYAPRSPFPMAPQQGQFNAPPFYAYNNVNCRKFNHGYCPGCSRPHQCVRCNGFHPVQVCSQSSLPGILTGTNNTVAAPNGQGAAQR